MSPFFQSSQKEARKDVTFRRLLCYISEQHLHEIPPHITVDIVGSSTLANSHLFSRCLMSTPGRSALLSCSEGSQWECPRAYTMLGGGLSGEACAFISRWWFALGHF